MSDSNALDSDHHIANARRLIKAASDEDTANMDLLAAAQTHAILALVATVRDVVEAIDRVRAANVRSNDRL